MRRLQGPVRFAVFEGARDPRRDIRFESPRAFSHPPRRARVSCDIAPPSCPRMEPPHPHAGRPLGAVGRRRRLREARHCDQLDQNVMKTHTPEARAKAEETKRLKREKNQAEQAARDYCEAHGLDRPRVAAPHEVDAGRAAHQERKTASPVPENLSWAHRAPICCERVQQKMNDPHFREQFPLHQYLMDHLREFRDWLSLNRVTPAEGYLTMAKINEKIQASFRGPSMGRKKLRALLRGLGFSHGPLIDSYFIQQRQRPYVQPHLRLFVPSFRFSSIARDHAWFGDSTWIHANNPPRMGWRDEADEHGNEDRRAQAGIGARVGMECYFYSSRSLTVLASGYYAFINTSVGVLRKADGTCLREKIESGEKIDADLVHAFCRSAVTCAQERYPDRIHVFLLDGYNAHCKLPPDAIDPSQINASDGGKNRKWMNTVGLLGLRSIFAALGVHPPQSTVQAMRATLADWKAVRDQYSVVEDIFRAAGCVFLYNTPYFPQLNGPIEHLWRYGKGATRRRAQCSLRVATEAFEERAFGPVTSARPTLCALLQSPP